MGVEEEDVVMVVEEEEEDVVMVVEEEVEEEVVFPTEGQLQTLEL